jgi:hypothetical protein
MWLVKSDEVSDSESTEISNNSLRGLKRFRPKKLGKKQHYDDSDSDVSQESTGRGRKFASKLRKKGKKKGRAKESKALSPLRTRGYSPMIKSSRKRISDAPTEPSEEVAPPPPPEEDVLPTPPPSSPPPPSLPSSPAKDERLSIDKSKEESKDDGVVSCHNVRHIRFSEAEIIYEIISLDEYTSDEKKAYWLQEHEYYTISETVMKQVDKMERGIVLRDNKYSSRGLEALTSIAAMNRSKNRELEWDLVLEEQFRQREDEGLSVLDLERIALHAKNATSGSQLWAHVIGLRDELASDDL